MSYIWYPIQARPSLQVHPIIYQSCSLTFSHHTLWTCQALLSVPPRRGRSCPFLKLRLLFSTVSCCVHLFIRVPSDSPKCWDFYSNVSRYPSQTQKDELVAYIRQFPGFEDYSRERLAAWFKKKRKGDGMTNRRAKKSETGADIRTTSCFSCLIPLLTDRF